MAPKFEHEPTKFTALQIAEENGPRSVKTIQVIEVRHRKGAGFATSAVREVVEYYHLDGRKIAVEDPFDPKETKP